MRAKSAKVQEKEYQEKYGHIPDTNEEILKYIESTKKLNWDKIHALENNIRNLKWNTLDIVLPVIPTPSPRPRYSSVTHSFYVVGAKENHKLIKKYLVEHDIIYTRTHFYMETYQPTPSSMTNDEMYCAEKKLIEPLQNGDWDNLAKTYCDMLQGDLLLNDNIISRGTVQKYYSIKPRVVMKIMYQDGFDCKFNERRITRSTAYLNSIKVPYEDVA